MRAAVYEVSEFSRPLSHRRKRKRKKPEAVGMGAT
jgi:hypothetical protein